MNKMNSNVGKGIGEASIMQTILLNHFHYCVKDLLHDEEGATAIEYGLMAALIGATVLTAQAALGNAVMNMYTGAMGLLTAAMGS
jgi:pilus assembly protein Flp/PilA